MTQDTLERGWHVPHLLLLSLLPVVAMGAPGLAPELRVAGWLLLNVAVIAAAERWRPYRADWRPTRADLVRDGGVFALNALVDALAKMALAVVALRFVSGASALPGWLQVIGGALLADLGSYALHRWSHRGGWLWRVHAFHHRPEALNVANALTAHPLNALYDGVVRWGPLVLLGFDAEVITALAMFHLTQALAAHANVRGIIGPLRWVLGSAELHRLHHSTDGREAGNFGTDLPLWDLVFGTHRSGPGPRAVGVCDPARYPVATATGRWLAWPFQRRPSTAQDRSPST
jgi:sterol desaturase/sphingolipid hydroxylase (fatty acid hydroxylase superfamily)